MRLPAAACASSASKAPRSRWSARISDAGYSGPERRQATDRRGGDRRAALRQPLPKIRGTENLYSLGEEIAHAATHGFGALLSVAGLCFLVARALAHGNAWHVTAVSIFGVTLVLMYSASTLYHAIPMPRAKHLLRVIDHSLIFFLIAGSYTPFTLITLRESWGWGLFAFVWALAFVGVLFKIRYTGRYEKASVIIYLAMGWSALVAIRPLVDALDPGGLALLFAGGITYSGGVAFYVWNRLRYHHAIWHLFVLAGSILHWCAIYFYVLPGPAAAS